MKKLKVTFLKSTRYFRRRLITHRFGVAGLSSVFSFYVFIDTFDEVAGIFGVCLYN